MNGCRITPQRYDNKNYCKKEKGKKCEKKEWGSAQRFYAKRSGLFLQTGKTDNEMWRVETNISVGFAFML